MTEQILTEKMIAGCIALGPGAPEFCAVAFDGMSVSARRVLWSPVWGALDVEPAPRTRRLGVADRLLQQGVSEDELRVLAEWGRDPADGISTADWMSSATEAIREVTGRSAPVLLTPDESEWSSAQRLHELHGALPAAPSNASGTVGRVRAAANASGGPASPAAFSLLAVAIDPVTGAQLVDVPLYGKGQALDKKTTNAVGPLRFAPLGGGQRCTLLLQSDGEIVGQFEAVFRDQKLEVEAAFRCPEVLPVLRIGGNDVVAAARPLSRGTLSLNRHERPLLFCILLEATLDPKRFSDAVVAIRACVSAVASSVQVARFAFVTYADYESESGDLPEKGSDVPMTAADVDAALAKATSAAAKDAFVAVDRGLDRLREILDANAELDACALLVAEHPPHPMAGEDYPGRSHFSVRPAAGPWRDLATAVLQRCKSVFVVTPASQPPQSYLERVVGESSTLLWNHLEQGGAQRMWGVKDLTGLASRVRPPASWNTTPVALPLWRKR